MNVAKPSEFTGWHMLAITVAFFGVIIGVNVFMAISASRTWTGLVVQNSYVASQQFQEKAEARHRQDAAGWTVTAAYEAGELVVRLLDDGAPLRLDEVIALVRRPVGGHDDATLTLEPTSGTYRGAVELAAGVWDITITTGPTPLGPIERESRITVP